MMRGLSCALVLAALAVSPVSASEVELVRFGRQLFFDTKLSADRSVNCASCHQPDRAFSDGRPTSAGAFGKVGTRNTPSLVGAGGNPVFFWDGRQTSLEAQVLEPFLSPQEHGLQTVDALVNAVRADSSYARFLSNGGISKEEIALAVSAFVRSLNAASRFDRYRRGDKNALSEAERRGMELFIGPAQCSACHTVAGNAPLTDYSFHSIGVGLSTEGSELARVASLVSATESKEAISQLISASAAVGALGRYNATKRLADLGKFRTPSLRNVGMTAPYMHDGSVPTLEAAVERELYYRSASQGRPVSLTPDERKNLIAFLHALTTE